MTEAGAKPPRTYEPKDPAGLSRLVILFLWIDLVVGLFNGVSTLAELQILGRLPMDTPVSLTEIPGLPPVAEVVRAVVGLAVLVSFVATGFLCLKWVYRVSLNAHALIPTLTISPGWAVGWYFVPIALLLKPFQAMKETWQASANPAAWRSVDTPSLLRWWWFLWLLSSILGNLSFRLQLEAKSLDLVLASDVVDIVGAVVAIPLNLVFIRIVRRVNDMQVGALSQRVFA
ncbi:DUF4328 domain-containing protein [Caulobacter sp. KR2-114]|uniref:DUF4328 domain-containing protein n=1 Tax=Caulobacter sp. KR2-114 TaxID=3400912 RepID=UPI003C039B4F